MTNRSMFADTLHTSCLYTLLVNLIIGHSKTRASLQKVLNGSHKHHAFIFAGPRGVGKFLIAREFAKEIINTENDSHPNLHVIKKEDVVWSSNPSLQKKKQTNIPIDLMREKMIGGTTSDGVNHDSLVFKTPLLGKQKVFIVDEAELLDEPSQNAILKTLEEPPVDTTIILVTSREDRLFETTKSRCHLYSFGPLSNEDLGTWARERVDVGGEELDWALEFACGSPGVMEEAIACGVYQLNKTVSLFLQGGDSGQYALVVESINNFVQSYVERQIKINTNASKESLNRIALEIVLRLFGTRVQQILRGGDVDLGLVLAGIVSDVEGQVSTNISTKVLVESLVSRWVYGCVGDSVFITS